MKVSIAVGTAMLAVPKRSEEELVKGSRHAQEESYMRHCRANSTEPPDQLEGRDGKERRVEGDWCFPYEREHWRKSRLRE